MRRTGVIQAAWAAALLAGCDPTIPTLDLERMIEQARASAYEATPYFEDGSVMREPPRGTIPRERIIARSGLTTGVMNGAYLERFPLMLTEAALEIGQDRYHVYCSPCHGETGDGVSWVAVHMTLRKPPTLVGEAASALPVGRLYQVIREGYGLMRPYADDLSVAERWAVVAYVRALQASHQTVVETLPPRIQDELRRALP